MYLDSVYKSYIISKLINILVNKSTKYTIEIKILYLIKYIKFKFKTINPIFFIYESIEILKPTLGLHKIRFYKNRRILINFTTYKLKSISSYNLSIKWFKLGVLSSIKLNLYTKIFIELLNILIFNQGISIQKKLQHYKYIT